MSIFIRFITVFSWIVGGVGTPCVFVILVRREAFSPVPLLLVVCADAWLIARYLL